MQGIVSICQFRSLTPYSPESGLAEIRAICKEKDLTLKVPQMQGERPDPIGWEVQAVSVVLEDWFLLIAAGGDVIDCTCVFDAKRTGHEATIAEERAKCKEKDLTLKVLVQPRLCIIVLPRESKVVGDRGDGDGRFTEGFVVSGPYDGPETVRHLLRGI
jgi:hypothetical protein